MRSSRRAAGIWSGDESRRGAVAVLVALMLVVIIGFVSLGSEVVLLLLTSRQMQSAADAAALGAVSAQLSGSPSDYTHEAFALAAAAGFADGQTTACPLLNPMVYAGTPCDGAHTNDSAYVEVLIREPQTLVLANVVYQGPLTVSARAVARASGNGSCALVLDPASGALSMNGNSIVNLVGCDVSVNSTAANAVQLVGGATINTNHMYDSGGYTLTGSSQINATTGITTQAPATVDPYANYIMPPAAATCIPALDIKTNTSIPPGTYCSIKVSNATLSLSPPGNYIIKGGSLTVTAGATLTGSGVTIVLTGSGSNYATVSIAANSTVTLTAPSNGAEAGLVFFQDRNAPVGGGPNTFNGGANQVITGALYFPNQTVDFAGGAAASNACTQIVAWDLSLVGSAVLEANCTGTGVQTIGAGQPQLVE